jgi:hypothetical protein
MNLSKLKIFVKNNFSEGDTIPSIKSTTTYTFDGIKKYNSGSYKAHIGKDILVIDRHTENARKTSLFFEVLLPLVVARINDIIIDEGNFHEIVKDVAWADGKRQFPGLTNLETYYLAVVFGICQKLSLEKTKYPVKAFSWEVLTDDVAVKHMDKSVFLHHGSGIPQEIAFYFNLAINQPGEQIKTTLVYAGKDYEAHFEMDAHSRFRLFWKADFSKLIQSEFSSLHLAYSRDIEIAEEAPIIRFEKFATGGFAIDFIKPQALKLYSDFKRQDVHEIFAPHTQFTPQAGTWGMHDIVSIPDRPGDFVFFVSYGRKQGSHTFDEGITRAGVLSWQSQPRQSLSNSKIQQLINHNELYNSIYLFLRTAENKPYTYLGRLKYLAHDKDREKPVYFQWQILDWNITDKVCRRMGLEFHEVEPEERTTSETGIILTPEGLTEVPVPSAHYRTGVATKTFRGSKSVDYSARDAKNRELGLAGELAVLEYEKALLISAGHPELAKRVRHVSEIEGDSAGYDIESCTPDAEAKYIEVKTTKGGVSTDFFMSSNEVKFSSEHAEHYYIYRVHDFDKDTQGGRFFVVRGTVIDNFELIPTQYRVRLLSDANKVVIH